jgi:hypothetical protein
MKWNASRTMCVGKFGIFEVKLWTSITVGTTEPISTYEILLFFQ